MRMIQWFFPICLRRLLFPKRLAARDRLASVLLCFLLAFVAGYGQKAHPSMLRIDDYGLHYKGDTLHPGQDTTRWIAILGPPSRVVNKREMSLSRLIWDDLGIAVETGSIVSDKAIVARSFFFFCNLKNCKEGLEGKIYDHWSSGYSGLFTKKKENEWRESGTDEITIEFAKTKNDPSNYIYTYSTLRKVYLDGIPLNRHSKIETLNPKRKAANLSLFRMGGWPWSPPNLALLTEKPRTSVTEPGQYMAIRKIETKPISWFKMIHYGWYGNLMYLVMVGTVSK
jgi:hypothetical protein